MSKLQDTASRGESAISPGTEAFLPVLNADWNPSDKMASSSVLLMIDEERFTVLYQDVYLFKRVRGYKRCSAVHVSHHQGRATSTPAYEMVERCVNRYEKSKKFTPA